MNAYEFWATALVVGVIGPLFWLGVSVFDNWVQRNIYPKLRAKFPRTAALLGKEIGRRKPARTAEQLRGAGRVGQEKIGR